ncbi:hypothetical protein [Cupriavidus taiwanensis]|uniref:hypothetical protein n=1 Tax=Cupriavidus taiwanensis TaxID=164546 RepID=UPI000401867E|nr:hypothetical protein [Cupriavidus taiwanensis]SOZ12058.1 conserved protein of unknown function [Cupriavidus taiwanensis]
MKSIPDLELRAIFEKAAGAPIIWTDELQQLAVGYFSTLSVATEEPNPMLIHELTAMAVSLSTFAYTVEWISTAANDGLKTNAFAVRKEALRKFAGQVVAVRIHAGTAVPATTH